MGRDLKDEVRQLFEAALKAVDPKRAVKRFVALEGSILRTPTRWVISGHASEIGVRVLS